MWVPDFLEPHVRGLPSVGTDGFSKFLFFTVTIKTIMNAIYALISI